MLDGAADPGDSRRNDVAPVGNRRRPEYDHQLRREPEQFRDRSLKRRLLVRYAAFGHDGGAGGGQPLRRHPQGFLDHFLRQPRQQGRDDPDPLDDIGRDPQRPAAARRHSGVAQLRLDAEGNEFDRRDHLAFDHRFEGGKRGKSDCFIDAVDTVHLGAIHHQHTGFGREQIGAAGKGALDMDAIADDGLCDAGGGDVFGDVAVFEPHDHDFLDARAVQRLDLCGADRGALLQHQRSLTQGVDGDAANRVPWTGGAELHAAASLASFGSRNCAVISAMIETAISDGDTAPIGRPIGA